MNAFSGFVSIDSIFCDGFLFSYHPSGMSFSSSGFQQLFVKIKYFCEGYSVFINELTRVILSILILWYEKAYRSMSQKFGVELEKVKNNANHEALL